MGHGLPARTLSTLDSIFRRYAGIRQVILYGSRAKGNYREGSDIDITLETDGSFTFNDLLRISGDFYDSDMPYSVDVSVYNELSNPDLISRIDRVGKVLWRREDPSRIGLAGR
ncbi:MAG: nucleotidyltransferase domain-containing protein [Spirochaetaceae bacterium]|jgi:predicted nucleotidyltransferase|nr:nucleotidyltransferase domain-containing protein [Spirochaetaceae bacterium]